MRFLHNFKSSFNEVLLFVVDLIDLIKSGTAIMQLCHKNYHLY